jgi:hypothetical protein
MGGSMLVLFGVLACNEPEPTRDTGNAPLLDDSATDDSSSDDTATESTPDDTAIETGDSGADDSGTPGATVSGIAATEHPVISSIRVRELVERHPGLARDQTLFMPTTTEPSDARSSLPLASGGRST